MASRARNKGASAYLFPKRMYMAGWARVMTIMVTGTTRREAYFTEV